MRRATKASTSIIYVQGIRREVTIICEGSKYVLKPQIKEGEKEYQVNDGQELNFKSEIEEDK